MYENTLSEWHFEIIVDILSYVVTVRQASISFRLEFKIYFMQKYIFQDTAVESFGTAFLMSLDKSVDPNLQQIR